MTKSTFISGCLFIAAVICIVAGICMASFGKYYAAIWLIWAGVVMIVWMFITMSMGGEE